ncbi:MAG: type III-A CRISPR-associated RAMP protein Csm4 [Candidatus Methanoperedens sp.]|nr:type III-A CRISPR-associated RAMP protein Csm4 [Candidatus Methanoperedens sp.]MCZ7405295.1 type III-A CRISPR-associated RAMP protein Csm4 [Candidatus Methanoperedens sp.]
MKIIKLIFNSPLHIGEIGLGLEECSPIIHSDTIFNSIINAHSLMHSKEETDDFVKKFNTIKISSGFPFCGNEIYFPKPKIKLNIDEKTHSDHSKNLKKTEFVSKEYFEKIINFKELNETDITKITKKIEIYEEFQIPKVYLDRETNKSGFFFISLIKFKKDCGLWFSIDCENDVYDEIISCLRLLGEEGIGGKRTWGYGLFEFKEKDIELIQPAGNSFILLSLFYPDKNEKEIFSDNSSWDFVLRGGWTGKERKPRIRMIKEGGVFEKMPEGCIINLNKYSIYGKAYSLRIRGK